MHRRTKEEDVKLEEEQKANKEQLNEILEEKGIEFLNNGEMIENKNPEKDNKRVIIISLVIVIVIGIFIIYKLKNKNKKLQ